MSAPDKGGLLGKLLRLLDWLDKMDIPRQAASTCYFICLAVFPALVLVLSLLHYTSLDVQNLTAVLDGVLPAALMPYARRLILNTYQNTNGAMISLSALFTLWSASRGVYGLLTGLNAVYGIQDDRSWLRTRLLCVGYTFAFLLVLAMTLAFHVFGRQVIAAFSRSPTPFLRFLADVIDLRFFLLLGLQTALFTAMFTVFPNHSRPAADSLPGALLASLGWLVFSNLFSLYIDYFGDHTHIYGQLYTMVLGMLWLYFCLCIVFFGGAVNRFLSPLQ